MINLYNTFKSVFTLSDLMGRGTRLLALTTALVFTLFSTTMAQPAVPVLSSPADSAIDQPQNLTLSWNSSANADTYHLQVSTDANFNSTVVNQSELSDTTRLVSDLDLNTDYYWRVSATSSGGTSDFSPTRVFTTWESVPTSPDSVNLGTAGNYVLLAKTEISTVPSSDITGDVGISPAAASYITGFDLTHATGYATSPQVTGKVYAADMASPTPSNLTTAVSDMETAYTDAAGRVNPDFVELHAGNLGGKTLIPGLYKWGTTVIVPSSFEINGDENSIYIFQIAGDLTISSDINVTLSGGVQAKNIFWQVAGEVTIGTNAHFEGIILSKTAINLRTGASLNGRVLAQSAITLDQNPVTQPTSQATSIGGTDNLLPDQFALSQNYPNPFNPATTIEYAIPEASHVEINVYNIMGREVANLVNSRKAAGRYSVQFDASNFASGIYLYRINTDNYKNTKRMMLVK